MKVRGSDWLLRFLFVAKPTVKERIMKKRIFAIISVIMCVVTLSILGVSCTNKEREAKIQGEDAYGRVFGNEYDIDSKPTGVFRMPFEIGDISSVIKGFIKSYSKNYIQLEVCEDEYVLTFFCKSVPMSETCLTVGDYKTEGVKGEGENGYISYSFTIKKEFIDQKMFMSCKVDMLNKYFSYSIKADKDSAWLVG